MNPIWIYKLPIPPSTNSAYETNVYKKKRADGKLILKTGIRKSEELQRFQDKCQEFKIINAENIQKIAIEIHRWIAAGYFLEFEIYVALEHSRILTKDGKAQRIDSDNRAKSAVDAISKMIGVDDKNTFRVIIEKVTCNTKDSQQCLIKITPMKPRTLLDIHQMMADTQRS